MIMSVVSSCTCELAAAIKKLWKDVYHAAPESSRPFATLCSLVDDLTQVICKTKLCRKGLMTVESYDHICMLRERGLYCKSLSLKFLVKTNLV